MSTDASYTTRLRRARAVFADILSQQIAVANGFRRRVLYAGRLNGADAGADTLVDEAVGGLNTTPAQLAAIDAGAEATFPLPAAPNVATTSLSGPIGNAYLLATGTLLGGGTAAVTARGFVWNTAGPPLTLATASGVVTDPATYTGVYSEDISGFSGVGYIAAYATNGIGTAYGATLSGLGPNFRIPPSCVLWLDAADVSGTGNSPASDSPLSTWVDKSLNGNDVSIVNANTPPIFKTNIVNGLPGVLFGPNGTVNSMAGGTNNFPVGSSGVCIAAVFQGNDYSHVYTPIYCLGPPSNSNCMNMFVFDSHLDANFNNAYSYGGGQTLAVNTTYAVIINYLGGPISADNPQFYIGGTLQMGFIAGGSTPSIIGNSSIVGNFTTFTTYNMQGYINELAVFNAPLTTLQVREMSTYFRGKWGV